VAERVRDLNEIPDAIRRLQRSSRRAVPLTIIGLLATLAAAGVAIYYIFNISAQLAEANRKLEQAEAQVATARQAVAATEAMLRETQVRPQGTRGEATGVEQALASLQTSRQALNSASQSIEQAVETLPEDTAVPSGGWFVVLASYPAGEGGLAEARQHIGRPEFGRTCATIWRTAISNHTAVVLGVASDRDAARENAGRARANGLAADAFAQRDSGWALLGRSAGCAASPG
jgi:hypothetical protein